MIRHIATLAFAICLAACDSGAGGDKPQQASAATQAALDRIETEKATAEADAAKREAARAAEAAAIAGAFADEASMVAACTAAGKQPEACNCLGAAASKHLGASGLFSWGFEAFLVGGALPINRANRWLDENVKPKVKSEYLAAADACFAD